jgi:DNA-binding response OmpR family regulator
MRSSTPSLGLEVDTLRRNVRLDGTPVDLTAIEFGILAALARDPGVLITRAALLHEVWGPGYAGEEQLVDGHVRSLRRKLGDDGERPILVEVVPHLGYRLTADS